MTLTKSDMIHIKEIVTRYFIRPLPSGVFVLIAILFINPLFAQGDKSSSKPDTSSAENDPLTQLFDYSRPGKYHQLLADIAGSWTFKGSNYYWADSVTRKVAVITSGTILRRPFANGRFFIVDMTTAEKVQLPIQDGKMINDYGRGIQM
jgi:hypothetical protein